MSNEQWYYARGGQQAGPVSRAELQQIGRQGGLGPDDLVWTETMADWRPARTVTGLLAAVPPPPPPPIPRPGGVGGPPAAARPSAMPPGAIPLNYGGGYAPGQPPAANDLGQNAGARWLLPVGRSGWAIAAGYLGLLSVLMVPAPLALLFGILAIRDIKRNPQRHGMGRAIFGIVMGALFTVVLLLMLVSVGGRRRF
jgi:hypothetical protein